MPTIAGMPYYEVEFGQDGGLDGDGGLTAAVAAGGIGDVFVLAHGWNTDDDSARDLYRAMFTILSGQLGSRRTACAAVGVLWPSLLFPDDDPATAPPTPSTGAQLATALRPAFPDQHRQLNTLGALLDSQPQDPARLVDFHTLTTQLVTTPAQGEEDTGEAALIGAKAGVALAHGAAMAPAVPGDEQGIGNVFDDLWRGGRELWRTLSYYEMKNRAGVVGQRGLGPLLGRLAGPPRIHLMGHSFGARLVAYALAGLPSADASPVKSVLLIQGAFSHFTFAPKLPFDPSRSGALAGFADRVDGPLLATFSAADRAIGWWYPAASMLARQDNQTASDLVYQWGGMGYDGFQQQDPAPTTRPLGARGTDYGFRPGVFYRLDANAVIKANQSALAGAHSDIRHEEVLWAITSAALG